MEECAELIQAISKAKRGKINRDNMIEEIADVLICIEMLKQMYMISDEKINGWIEKNKREKQKGWKRMNKKEISEIKKQFTPANCSITRICGCYVDAEKNKKTKIKEAFLSLPEEEMFKYFDIFKKTMSGRLGKDLMNLEFPLAQEKRMEHRNFLCGSEQVSLKMMIFWMSSTIK